MTIKTGDTFQFTAAHTTTAGVAIDLTGYTIFLDLTAKDGTVLLDAAVGSGITVTSAGDGLWETAETDTIAWPLGQIKFDIKYVTSGFVTHTETGILQVQEGLSQ